MRKGKVLWFDWNRGFGFIQDLDNTDLSYFVHYTSIVSDKVRKSGKPEFKKLIEGEEVTKAKVTARLTALVNNGIAEKTDVKDDECRKLKAYKLVA